MQKLNQQPVTRFNRGLITEAGELTFPEGASTGESNMLLLRDGSRRRRLGIAYETGYSEGAAIAEGNIVSTHVWESPDGQASLKFLVVQNGATLLVYTTGADNLSDEFKTSYALSAQQRPTGTAGAAPVQTTVINGELIVVSPELNTFKYSYDSALDTFSASSIDFRIRDYEWLSDRSLFDAPVASPVPVDRQYDTLNGGWRYEKGAAALADYESNNSNDYPELTHPWYSGKDSNDNFSQSKWKKVYSGSSIMANGSFILDLLDEDRATASGIAGVEGYTESTRFATVASYASRIWFAGMTSSRNTSRVFFSQLLDENGKLGEFLQQNDPTAEDFSDLLDTDGGVVEIPEMYGVRKLHPLGPNLLVFATNGVWQIRGIDDSFKPTGYSINKVSDVGLAYETSFVSAEGRPYWWSEDGIYTVQASEEGSALNAVNISLPTIQTFWLDILASKKAQVVASYDRTNNRVIWLYPSNTETIDYKLNELLVLDEPLQAFYPWTISDTTGTSPYIVGAQFISGTGGSATLSPVINGALDNVITIALDDVVVDRIGSSFNSSSIAFVVSTPSRKVTFAGFTGTDFLDWGSADFSSYAQSGYNFLGDLTTKKNVIYITSYLKTTEDTITGNDTDGYSFERPSSCLVSSYWDFSTSPGSPTTQQAYRLKNLPIPDAAGPFEYPNTVTTSRLRIRGRGRSLYMKYESEEGFDFHLLGFDTISARNPRF